MTITTTNKAKWYVIRVAGNKEKSMSEKIKTEIRIHNLEKNVFNIIVPTEKNYSMKAGKKVIKESILYPSYVLIETDNISEIKNILKGYAGVSGFIGDRSGNPAPITTTEVNRMIGRIEESEERIKESTFIVGESIKIID